MGHNLLIYLREAASLSTNVSLGRTKACLDRVQEHISGDNHEQYFGEDFADLVAIKMQDGPGRPRMCQYLIQDTSSNIYRTRSIFNEYSWDDHSSYIFRILKSYIDQGRTLPNYCRYALFDEAKITGLEDRCPFFE